SRGGVGVTRFVAGRARGSGHTGVTRVVAGALALALCAACGTTVGRSALQSSSLAGQSGGSPLSGAPGGSSTAPTGSSPTGSPSSPSAAGSTGSITGDTSSASGLAGGGPSVPLGAASATGPIEIGIVRTQVSNSAAYGASLGNTVTEADVDNA